MRKSRFIKGINPKFNLGIAHRGLHNSNDSENGLRAFNNALNLDLAIELDVHLTKDKKIVVFHDSQLKRMTGREGIIEDLTLEEIRTNYRLLDGEFIPTLKEVFDLIKEQVPIVVELKVYNKNYHELTKYVKEELKVIKDKKNIIIISFDPRALLKMRFSGFKRQLLVTIDPKYSWIIKLRHFFDGVDLEYKFLDQEKIIKYQKNHYTNIWTVETKEVFEKYYKLVDTITFQHLDPQYVKEMMKNR